MKTNKSHSIGTAKSQPLAFKGPLLLGRVSLSTLFALAGVASAMAQSDAGPVRMVRFSSVSGPVEWRPDAKSQWSDATQNLPVREGAQIWSPAGARAEMQFDDGTILRLSSDTTATLTSLYSDSQGEFTQIKLNQGHAYLHAPHAYSVFQFDTPDGSVKADGPTRLRLNADSDVKLALYGGKAVVQNDSGAVTVFPHEYAEVASPNAGVVLRNMPKPDSWDNYNSDRDAVVYRPKPYEPDNIALVSGDMDSYGHWVNDPTEGNIWLPRETDPNWRPYSHGHWTWVDPYGWTWVASEPWGWAPYHYGAWVHRGYGWGWRPGPSSQYWSPAVVQFSYGNGMVAWAPLDPSEVRYPASLSIGFSSGDWSLFFSIGGAAVYCSDGSGYCSPRPWRNYDANRGYGSNNFGNVYNNTTIVNNNFVTRNARYGGGTQTSLAGFRGNSGFKPMAKDASRTFQNGRALAFNTRSPVSGPPAAIPNRSSYSPTRSFASRAPSSAVLNRPVVHVAANKFESPAASPSTRTASHPAASMARGQGSFARPGTANANRGGTSQTTRTPSVRQSPGATAAMAARQSLGVKPRPGMRQAMRPASSNQTSSQRALGFAKRATPSNRTNPSRTTPSQNRAATAKPKNIGGSNRTVRQAPAQKRQATSRQTQQRSPQRNATQRQPQQRAPQRQPQQRQQQQRAPQQRQGNPNKNHRGG